jgi:CRP-like cAMP-binding protein
MQRIGVSSLEAPANKLLAKLPAAERRRLLLVLEPLTLSSQQVLQKPGDPLHMIYFPGEGVYSITQIMDNGRMVEVAMVGNEGFVGINALFDGDRWLGGVLIDVPDRAAQCMSVRAFRREMHRRGRFARLVNRYAQGFVASLMRSAACNALHSVEQRCARWLLTTRDHVGRNDFPLTQEFLSMMLGVRRASVTLALVALQRAGLIEYGRGRAVIIDRRRLERASCGCYVAVKRQFARIRA